MSYDAQPVGFLADVVARVREYIDDPDVKTKWTTDKVWPMIVDAWGQIMLDLTNVAENPIIVSYNISVVDDTQTYTLPANMGTFMGLYRVEDATEGTRTALRVPGGRRNPNGPGLLFEGNVLRFRPDWGVTETLQIDYIPNGHCALHTGSTNLSDGVATASQLTLDYEPDEGYFDRTPNAYVGSVIRVLNSTEIGDAPGSYIVFPVQERVITAVDTTTLVATLNKDLDFDPTADAYGSCPYEVLPFHGYALRGCVAWLVASMIKAVENPKEASPLQHQYLRQLRAIRLKIANMNGVLPSNVNGSFLDSRLPR